MYIPMSTLSYDHLSSLILYSKQNLLCLRKNRRTYLHIYLDKYSNILQIINYIISKEDVSTGLFFIPF